MTRSWWVSCGRFTVRVETRADLYGDDQVVSAAPIVRRFVGRPLQRLLMWAAGFGGVRVERMS